MAKHENAIARRARAEASFEDVSKMLLPVQFHAAAEGTGVIHGKQHACIDSGFAVGGGFGAHQDAGELDGVSLFAPGAGE
jgi:hypothetical protein